MQSNQRIKVLMLLPNLVSAGGQQAVVNLYRSLPASKFDLTLLVHENIGSFSGVLDQGINVHFVNQHEYHRTDLPKILATTIRYARKADIILGGLEGRTTFMGILAAKLLGKPIVTWLHIDWSPFVKTVSWRQRLALRFYSFADQIVTCSQGVADNFAKNFSLDRSRMTAIYNGIPSEKILKKAQVPLPEAVESIFAEPTVLTVGRLDPQKGQEYLIKAHALLKNKGIHHQLAIVGEGELRDYLQQQANDLGVADSVHFLGFQENPYKFMKRATVFAFSSRFEGFGLVLAESMLCGTPVVSTDCPSGPREVLADGKYGLLVESENVEALANGIEAVLCNCETRQTYAELGRVRSRAFDEKDISAQWQVIFEDLFYQSHPQLLQESYSLPNSI